MNQLTDGAIDKIMNGEDVEEPVLQYLGNKRLASSNNADRYRLLLSDGKRINSFTMLATQLNHLITDGTLTEFSIVQVHRYAISMVNNGGKQKRVMVILNIEVKIPGHKIGSKLGNPSAMETNIESENNSRSDHGAPSVPPTSSVPRKPPVQLSTSMNTSNQDESGIITTPIAALSPYQNKWIIKARVTSKSNIRTWSNSRGEGKLFSMDLVDESGEIRCTAFRDQVDKFYDMIEAGKIYFISRCVLKPANKQFNHLKNDYELTLTNDSEIVPCSDDSAEIPTLKFNFSPISEVENKEKNEMIDVLGIVKSYSETQDLVARSTGRELKKRDINIVDESNTMVTVTLWGKEAEDFNGENNPIIAIKGARISEFNGGKTLNTGSCFQIDPDIPEAHRLRGWFNSQGHSTEAKSISKSNASGGGMNGPWCTFREAKELGLGTGNTPAFYIAKAKVALIKSDNILYKSCPTEGCKKKLIDQDNDMYRCEKCGRDFPNFKYRLLANVSLADGTDNLWITCFSDEVEKIIGISAQELGELQENDNELFLEKIGDVAFRPFIFKVRVKSEMFNDEVRLRSTCMAVNPLENQSYNEHLLTDIREMMGIEKV